jgi:hypothetical protein
LLCQFATGELHHFSSVVQDVPVSHNVVWWCFLELLRNGQKVPVFIDLVVDVLGEWGQGHNGEAVVGYIWTDLWVQEKERDVTGVYG